MGGRRKSVELGGRYQLASGDPVMAIVGSTPIHPDVGPVQALVAQGTIHYLSPRAWFGGGGFGGGASATSSDSSQITSWVEATFTPTPSGHHPL